MVLKYIPVSANKYDVMETIVKENEFREEISIGDVYSSKEDSGRISSGTIEKGRKLGLGLN